jgi:hypothetical protein
MFENEIGISYEFVLFNLCISKQFRETSIGIKPRFFSGFSYKLLHGSLLNATPIHLHDLHNQIVDHTMGVFVAFTIGN